MKVDGVVWWSLWCELTAAGWLGSSRVEVQDENIHARVTSVASHLLAEHWPVTCSREGPSVNVTNIVRSPTHHTQALQIPFILHNIERFEHGIVNLSHHNDASLSAISAAAPSWFLVYQRLCNRCIPHFFCKPFSPESCRVTVQPKHQLRFREQTLWTFPLRSDLSVVA
jgi:hypothetical protein